MITNLILALPRRFAVAFALAGSIACSNSTEPNAPQGNGTISTSAAGEKLRVHNVSKATLRIAVMTQMTYNSGLADFCLGFDSCGQAVQAGQSMAVGRDDLSLVSQSAIPVYVFYWPQGVSTNTTPAPVNRIDAVLPPTR